MNAMTTTRRLLLLPALALALLGACGDDDGMGLPDAGPRLDGGPDGPVPFGIEVTVAPARSAYRIGQSVRLEVEVIDIDEEIIEGAEVVFSVEDDAAADMGEGVFELTTEGRIQFNACTVRAGPSGEEPLCDFAQIFVDAGAPNLEVTSPTPGAELGGGEATAIVVEGSVADTETSAGTLRVFVNGSTVELDEMGAFRTELPALFGINHIEVVASDGVTEDARVEMDVLWAEDYRPAMDSEGTRPEVTFGEGITLQLGQRFFDDGEPLDTMADPVRTEDLADIFELVLQNVDFRGFLPDPVIDNAPTLFLRITEVRTSDIDVVVDVVEGGAELFLRIGTLDADTVGNLEFEGTMLDLGGGLTASLSAFARLDVSKAGPEAPVEASVEELTIAIEDVEGRFRSAEANAILQLAEGLLRSTLEDQLRDAFGDSLLDAIPAVLADAIGSLDTALQDQTIPLETELFPPVTIQLDGRVASIDTRYRRWMRTPLQMTVSTDATPAWPESRGAADLVGVTDPLFETTPVQLGMKVALLNGLLHTLWNSGLLEIDATAILPEDLAGLVMGADLSGKLPPVIRPARGAETTDLVLALGQAELQLNALGADTRFGVTIEAGVTLDIVDGAIVLNVDEEPFIRTWIIESTEARPPINEEGLEGILRDQLWPELRGAVMDGLSLELPALEVGDLTGIAPELDGFALSFELARPLDVREDSAVADLAIVGTVPAGM
ncbi:MAG TPA: hypothetical protein RMG45_06000 [Polyangiaceae bacterium LLY-WYZ-15_(1-7)]|nr:hypothetical protein [Polyangiaceae bacterium LLY-WYZ-15_(1-7)]HJL45365.1 hypothetical protein [Polyangiaceae bacterium LLY-WYZ-15_(1-7)]